MICVGLPRAGTDWLYDQLAGHPDFWMPPIKELGALGGGFPPPPLKLAVERVAARTDDSGRGVPSNRKPLDARGFAFFERPVSVIASDRTLDDYATLFEQKGALLSGDVTPSYGRLPRARVAAISRRFPNAKAILMLRDPVERAWSHWRMRVALGRDEASDVQDAAAFARFLDMPVTAGVADAVAIADRWSAALRAALPLLLPRRRRGAPGRGAGRDPALHRRRSRKSLARPARTQSQGGRVRRAIRSGETRRAGAARRRSSALGEGLRGAGPDMAGRAGLRGSEQN